MNNKTALTLLIPLLSLVAACGEDGKQTSAAGGGAPPPEVDVITVTVGSATRSGRAHV